MHDAMVDVTWSADTFGLLFTVPPGLLYATGLTILLRRGDRWPAARVACFAAGLMSIFAVTCTPLGGLAMMSFSAHMVQHMVLNMIAPILLVLGAPVTLALRTAPPAARGVLLLLLNSRASAVLTNQFLIAGIFTGSLFALYFTPLFPMAMSSMGGHLLMQVHFLVSGYLFFWLLLGLDPGPGRPEHLARVPIVIVMVLTHTIFAFAVVFSQSVLGAEYFLQAHGTTLTQLRNDQALAGGIAWGLGELSSAVVIAILLIQWFARAERMEAAAMRRRRRRRAQSGTPPPGGQTRSTAGGMP